MKSYVLLAIVLAVMLVAAAAFALNFTYRTTEVEGISAGEVLLDNQVPLRIRYAAGGLSPSERAAVVARRLSGISDLIPSDIQAGRVGRYWGVLARGQLLITADPAHAMANNTTTYGLALLWRNQLRSAVSRVTGVAVPPPTGTGPGAGTGAGAGAGAIATVDTSQKVVPIISVGSGLRVGVALVTGSSTQVRKVNAVAQLEGQFGGRARIRALVPVDTENVITSIRRVPGTAVIAVGDIRL